MKSQLSDEEVLREFSHGTEEGFKLVFYRFYKMIAFYISKKLERYYDPVVDELTVEVFRQAFIKYKDLDTLEKFKSFVFICAKNSTLNYLKMEGRANKRKEKITKHFQQECNEEYEYIEESIHLMEIVKEEIDQLSYMQREVIILFFFKDRKIEEIAEILGITKSTVYVHKMRGIQLLQERIIEQKSKDI